jgi:hypothetical protein
MTTFAIRITFALTSCVLRSPLRMTAAADACNAVSRSLR